MATRGIALLLLEDEVLMSTEFNGDMYPHGYGDEFFEMLSKVESEEDFENFVKQFNDKHFQYADDKFAFEMSNKELYSPRGREGQPHINMRDVAGQLETDWIFMKNVTESTWITLEAYEGKLLKQTQVLPGDTHRYHYNSYPAIDIEYRIDENGEYIAR